MKYFRKLITYRKLAIFLAIGMLLRSTIAVGYMLDTSPADGSFLSVMICEGPAGINAIPGLENNKHQHHHQNHTDHGDSHHEHDHASQDHPMSSCSFWSSSSLSLFTGALLNDSDAPFLFDKIDSFVNLNASLSFNKTQFARAPPALS